MLAHMKKIFFYAIQHDETADFGNCSQLLVCACLMSSNVVKKEMLFCHPVKSHIVVADIFNVIKVFLKKQLS